MGLEVGVKFPAGLRGTGLYGGKYGSSGSIYPRSGTCRASSNLEITGHRSSIFQGVPI